jgi:16S rRNA (uracil1498-N3)-methyltransferase
MARRRFLVDQFRDGRAEISGEDAHHLARVLRVEVGQKFEVTDTKTVWLATVLAVRKSLVEFSLDEEIPVTAALPEVTLYLALIKFERFEWALEKATELGVTRVVPVEAARSERGLAQGAKKRVERWRRIAKEASEQSRRLGPPEVGDPVGFLAALSDPSRHRVWLDEHPGAPPMLSVFNPEPGDSTALIIGPEGGWSDHEREQFSASGWTGASLGPSVLRAETAVCAALAVFVQAAMLFNTQQSGVPVQPASLQSNQ